MNPGRVLARFAPAAVAAAVAAAAVSIHQRWPHQFGGHGQRNNVWGDFLTSGTALAPPLVLLVVFAVAAAMVSRTGRPGTIAVVVILLSAILSASLQCHLGHLRGCVLAVLSVLTIRRRQRSAVATDGGVFEAPPTQTGHHT